MTEPSGAACTCGAKACKLPSYCGSKEQVLSSSKFDSDAMLIEVFAVLIQQLAPTIEVSRIEYEVDTHISEAASLDSQVLDAM